MRQQHDQMEFKKRGLKTNYISGGNTKACDLMLEIEINGKRFRIPAFNV